MFNSYMHGQYRYATSVLPCKKTNKAIRFGLLPRSDQAEWCRGSLFVTEMTFYMHSQYIIWAILSHQVLRGRKPLETSYPYVPLDTIKRTTKETDCLLSNAHRLRLWINIGSTCDSELSTPNLISLLPLRLSYETNEWPTTHEATHAKTHYEDYLMH